jgi:hypothetical protein
MAETFPRVSPGDPLKISAETWNAVMGLGQRLQVGDSAANRAGDGSGKLPPGVIWIQNESGEDRAEFDVLGIDDILVSPDDGEAEFRYSPKLSCVTPVAGTHDGKWVVLLEAIKDGAIGKARIFGLATVTIDVTVESHTTADIADGEVALASTPSGCAQILWKESGTGSKHALIRFPVYGEGTRAQYVEFAARADFSYGDTITADVVDWKPDDADDPDPDNDGIEITNWLFYGDEGSQGIAAVLRDGTYLSVNVDCQEEIES